MADRLQYGLMMFPRGAAETRNVAERAEALGFLWLGIADLPTIYQESYLHQLEALRVTRRLTVGPVVTHVTLRHPLVVGNLLATLNEISEGRTVGVLATGNSGARGVGMPPATVQQLKEAVGAILWLLGWRRGTFWREPHPGDRSCAKGLPAFHCRRRAARGGTCR